MIVYPTMELQGGKVVSLMRGRMDAPSLWHVDPVTTGRDWAAAGAAWMHVTDLDGVTGGAAHGDLLEEIIRSVGIPVQLGGGFRTAEAVERWIDKGAGRIVLGTLAVQDAAQVQALAKRYPDQIVLSVDVYQGHVMVDGWRRESAIAPEALIEAYARAPLAGIILTDIDSDIEDVEARIGVIAGLARHAKAPVIASGVVGQVDDIARLKYVPGVDGVLLGRALFRKAVSLEAALAVAASKAEPVAEFL